MPVIMMTQSKQSSRKTSLKERKPQTGLKTEEKKEQQKQQEHLLK
jgi:hypothetical protein